MGKKEIFFEKFLLSEYHISSGESPQPLVCASLLHVFASVTPSNDTLLRDYHKVLLSNPP